MSKSGLTQESLAKTDLRTLWSETLIELLLDAVKEEWSDHIVQDIVKELYNKGYKTEQLIKLLEKKLGPDAATKMARFLF